MPIMTLGYPRIDSADFFQYIQAGQCPDSLGFSSVSQNFLIIRINAAARHRAMFVPAHFFWRERQ